MEVLAGGGVALLAGGSMLGLLGCLGGPGTDGHQWTAADVRAAAAEIGAAVGDVVRHAVQATGSLLVDAGVLPASVRVRLAAQARRVHIGGRGVPDAADDAFVLGAVAWTGLCAGALLGIVAWSVLGIVVGAAAVPIALWAAALRRERAQESKVAEAMPEAFGSLAISLESGLSLPQAMRYVGGHSEEPVRGHFLRASFAMSCGVSAAEALDDMVRGLSAPGLDLVSLALKISQRTGSPLKDLLSEASQLAGERIELARRLDVKTSQARMSAQLVAAMPVAMVGLLSVLSSDFRAGLATSTGAAAVSVALALNVVAWLIIRKIMQVEL